MTCGSSFETYPNLPQLLSVLVTPPLQPTREQIYVGPTEELTSFTRSNPRVSRGSSQDTAKTVEPVRKFVRPLYR